MLLEFAFEFPFVFPLLFALLLFVFWLSGCCGADALRHAETPALALMAKTATATAV